MPDQTRAVRAKEPGRVSDHAHEKKSERGGHDGKRHDLHALIFKFSRTLYLFITFSVRISSR